MALTPFTLPLRGAVPNQRARKVDLESGINAGFSQLQAGINQRATHADLTNAVTSMANYVSRVRSGQTFRPGHHPESYQSSLDGAPASAPMLAGVTTQDLSGLGRVAVMTGPGLIALREPVAMVPGRVYRVSISARRIQNPPSSHQVRASLATLNGTFQLLSEIALANTALVEADGIWRVSVTMGQDVSVAGVDQAIGSSVVYVRPVLRVEGIGHQTAALQIDWLDITEAALIDGALDAEALAAAVTAAEAAEAAADAHADRAEAAADRAEAVAQTMPTPALITGQTPAQNAAEIQAMLDSQRTVRLPYNREIVVDRSLLINPWNILAGDPSSVLKLADGSFQPLIMNRNAIAHAPGATGPSRTQPNPYMLTFAGEAQERTQAIFLDELYNYDLANAYSVAPGATVTMPDGLRYWVVAHDATNTPIENQNGVRFVPARDIASAGPSIYTPLGGWGPRWRMGVAGGFVLDHNGFNNKNTYERWRDFCIYWVGVQGLISEAVVRNSARWGCANGDVVDAEYKMEFDQPAAIGEQPDEEGFDEYYGNKDGIDFLPGCHRATVWYIKGRSNDDAAAFNVLYDIHKPEYPHNDPLNRYPKTLPTLNPRYPFYGPESNNCSKVHFHVNIMDPRGSHHWIRLLPGKERKLSQITLTLHGDLTNPALLQGNIYDRRWQSTAALLVGDANFDNAGPETISDINITDLVGTARRLIEYRGSASRITVNRLLMTYVTSEGVALEGEETPEEAFSQTAVVVAGQNSAFATNVHVATEGQTEFVSPPFYRSALTETGLTWTTTTDKIFVTWPDHGNYSTFRGQITFYDEEDEVIEARAYTWRREDANTVWTYLSGWAYPPAESSGTCDLRRNAVARPAMIRNSTVYNPSNFARTGALNNNTLRVLVNGVELPSDAYSEMVTGAQPEAAQMVELVTPVEADDVVAIERWKYPRDFLVRAQSLHVGKIRGGGSKPTIVTDPSRAPLQWGKAIDIRPQAILEDSVIRDTDMEFCVHVLEVHDGAAMRDTLFDGVTLRETGQMPFRFRTGANLAASTGNELRNVRVMDRSKVWLHNTTEDPASPFNGQIFSGRQMFRFSGAQPRVLAVDSFPIWARDGSMLEFDPETLIVSSIGEVLPWAMRARKVGDWVAGGATGRWVAYETIDGLPLSALVMPSAEASGGNLRAVTGQRFSNATPPPDGYSFRIKPTFTNTGSFGVAVDDMTSRAARCTAPLRASDSLPSGYLRIGVETPLIWSAAADRWLVGRAPETGRTRDEIDAGIRQDWILHEDGRLKITARGMTTAAPVTASGSIFVAEASYTLPVTPAAQSVIAMANCRSAVARWAVTGSVASGALPVRMMAAVSSATATTLDIDLEGQWW